jgi:glycine betaine/proline transport system substrate-binding protein
MARGRLRILALAASLGLAVTGLSACGSGSVGTTKTAGGSTAKCGDLRIALNNWTGYEANAYVVGEVAKKNFGCNVTYPKLDEQVSWQGMSSGSVDAVVENWGHADLVKKYIDQQHSVEDAGPTGGKGIIGWYVPPWMATKYPDITDWKNLNKYASLFKTSESNGKGQLLDGSPSYVTNDEALVKNLKLNYKVVVGGSEAALIQSFKTAEKNKTPLLAYFYEPQWFFSEMKLVHVNLPAYKTGCDAVAAKVNCDYPPYVLNKLIATKFAKSGSPAVNLIKKFTFSNDDQNLVAAYIAKDQMSPEAAADKWIAANPDKVKAWLG